MLKGLTPRLQQIVTVEAQKEAQRFNHDQVLPEHVMIALLKDGAGVAYRTLLFLHINPDDFKNTLEKNLPPGGILLVSGNAPPSHRMKRILEQASEEARVQGSDVIGTEHFLFASAEEKNSPSCRYLRERQVDSEVLRVVVQTTFSRNTRSWDPSSASLVLPPVEDRPQKAGELRKSAPRSALGQVPAPTLDEYSRDLSALARRGKLDPVVGRQREIDRAIRILSRRTKNNPILVGEPGVGKTAIVEGIAQVLASPRRPEALAGRRILSLDMASVVAGTKYRGEFEDRIKRIMKEISQAGNVILFIDEIHTIIGAGGAEGSIDASNMLKPGLSRGELQCIGATTLREYRRYFEKDGALERRFQMILVEEPRDEETLQILRGLQGKYEEFHGVEFSPPAVEAAVRLAQRYLPGRFMPDKAIDLLDEAASLRKLRPIPMPPEIAGVEEEIVQLTEKKAAMVQAQAYERAAELRDKARELRGRLEVLRRAWQENGEKHKPQVEEQDIRQVVSEMTGIPLTHLEERESRKLLRIEEEIHRDIVGQDGAVRAVAGAIRRSRMGVSSPNRPMGSFIFLGPTGVGKTLLAKRLAAYLFEKEDSLFRVDMSDYMEKHNAARLVGSPPGYVGYEEGGILTERIRRNPYQVILFDEIEKAHPEVFNLLLQILEEGELRDHLGHTVNFRSTVIILTSNAGVREISRESRLGFGTGSGILSGPEIEAAALSELKRIFSPEFLNRVDETIVFHPLEQKEIRRILALALGELEARLEEQGCILRITPSAEDILLQKGWDPKYGGRPLRRAIQRELEDPLALLLLEGAYPEGTVFEARGRGGNIVLRVKSSSLSFPSPDPTPSHLSLKCRL